MPDQIPVIGPSKAAPGVVHAFGFSAHGFELGPIVGQIVAELVVGGRSTLPIDAFAIDRFGEPRNDMAGALRD
ncbi:N-methyltryptophan oxidase [compost metagenome]